MCVCVRVHGRSPQTCFTTVTTVKKKMRCTDITKKCSNGMNYEPRTCPTLRVHFVQISDVRACLTDAPTSKIRHREKQIYGLHNASACRKRPCFNIHKTAKYMKKNIRADCSSQPAMCEPVTIFCFHQVKYKVKYDVILVVIYGCSRSTHRGERADQRVRTTGFILVEQVKYGQRKVGDAVNSNCNGGSNSVFVKVMGEV